MEHSRSGLPYPDRHKARGRDYHETFSPEVNPYRAMVWRLEQRVLDRILQDHLRSEKIAHLDFACGTGRILGHFLRARRLSHRGRCLVLHDGGGGEGSPWGRTDRGGSDTARRARRAVLRPNHCVSLLPQRRARATQRSVLCPGPTPGSSRRTGLQQPQEPKQPAPARSPPAGA